MAGALPLRPRNTDPAEALARRAVAPKAPALVVPGVAIAPADLARRREHPDEQVLEVLGIVGVFVERARERCHGKGGGNVCGGHGAWYDATA